MLTSIDESDDSETRQNVIDYVVSPNNSNAQRLSSIDLGHAYETGLIELVPLLRSPVLRRFAVTGCDGSINDTMCGDSLPTLLPEASCAIRVLQFNRCAFDSDSLLTLLNACRDLHGFHYQGTGSFNRNEWDEEDEAEHTDGHFKLIDLQQGLHKHADSLNDLRIDLEWVADYGSTEDLQLSAFPRLVSLLLNENLAMHIDQYPPSLQYYSIVLGDLMAISLDPLADRKEADGPTLKVVMYRFKLRADMEHSAQDISDLESIFRAKGIQLIVSCHGPEDDHNFEELQ